ncbi:MAG: diaminopimelate epimerase [Acidobacteriota bacterium]
MALPRRFVKMAGGGNDFLVFEADGRTLSEEDRLRLALLCRRGLSVGADGALFLSGGEASRIHLDYYNADGGLASFCANGTRCAARYAVTRRLVSGRRPVLETGWATIACAVEDDRVSLSLPPLPMPGDPLSSEGFGLPAVPMHVGVPHLVVLLPENMDLTALEVGRVAPALRHHPLLPEGANVNFVRVVGQDRLAVRTFERGVEAETLACGSGTVASAVVAARAGLVRPPVACETKSGAVFTVAFEDADGVVSNAVLTGDAREIFSGELTEEAWSA